MELGGQLCEMRKKVKRLENINRAEKWFGTHNYEK